MSMLQYTLKKPIVLAEPNPQENYEGVVLKRVNLRTYTAGHLALTRAEIAKHPAFGPELTGDKFTIMLFLIEYAASSPDGVPLMKGWAQNLSSNDYSEIVDILEADQEGFASVEAYREDIKEKARKAKEEALKAGDPSRAAFQAGV